METECIVGYFVWKDVPCTVEGMSNWKDVLENKNQQPFKYALKK